MRRLALILLCSLAGCGAADGPAPAALNQAVGEPMNGFPNPDERLMIMAINRARSDPATVKGPNSTIYPARPPIQWDYDLSRGSRFHGINLQLSNVSLMHTSPCFLNANVGVSGCDGTPQCACSGAVGAACANCNMNAGPINNCGTDPGTRLGYFTKYATGEVAAAGYGDTFAAVDGWVTEAAGADGHRMNLLDQGITSNVMGAGHAGKGCWATFDISDSGFIQGLALPKLPAASIKPVRGNANVSYRIYASWADANGGAPSQIQAVVDGVCTPMKLEIGAPKLNATYYVDVTLNAGCHNYWILAKDAGGARITYPTTGSLYVAAGAACGADYSANQPAAICEAPPADMSGATDMGMGMMAPDLKMVIDLSGEPRDLAMVAQPDILGMADLFTRDLLPPPGSDLASGPPDLYMMQFVDMAAGRPTDLAGPGVADLAGTSPADMAGMAAPDMKGVTTADASPNVPADMAGATAVDQARIYGDDAGGGYLGTPAAGCSCDVSARRASAPPSLAFAPLLALLGLRRRRR